VYNNNDNDTALVSQTQRH